MEFDLRSGGGLLLTSPNAVLDDGMVRRAQFGCLHDVRIVTTAAFEILV